MMTPSPPPALSLPPEMVTLGEANTVSNSEPDENLMPTGRELVSQSLCPVLDSMSVMAVPLTTSRACILVLGSRTSRIKTGEESMRMGSPAPFAQRTKMMGSIPSALQRPLAVCKKTSGSFWEESRWCAFRTKLAHKIFLTTVTCLKISALPNALMGRCLKVLVRKHSGVQRSA